MIVFFKKKWMFIHFKFVGQHNKLICILLLIFLVVNFDIIYIHVFIKNKQAKIN